MTRLTPTLAAYAAGRSIDPLWVSPKGRAFYPIAGGSQDPDPTPDPAPEPKGGSTPPEPTPDDGKTFTQADLDRILAGRLSKFADYDTVKQQLADVQAANQSESEKAINAAKDEGRAAAIAEAAPRLVGAEFRAALAGRRTAEQVADLIEDLDLSKYLTESGEVDTERVTKKAELLAPASEERKTAPSFGGGARKTADKPEATPGIGRLRSAYADTAK